MNDTAPKTGEPNDILLIGDWVVDEHWLLAEHQSDISSYTTSEHYRVLSHIGGLTDLCGAGHIARSLHHLQDEARPYKIWAVGAWREQDEENIYHFFHRNKDCRASEVPFGLKRNLCNQPNNRDRIELIRFGSSKATTRVIRRYRQRGSHIEQLSRDDWELPFDPETTTRDELFNKLPDPSKIRSIVVFDLNKGVASEDLIDGLTKKYTSARWYVRSKNHNPPWLTPLKDKIELLVFGPEVLANDNPIGTWQLSEFDTRRITWRTYQIFSTDTWRHVNALLILTEQNQIIARLNGQESYIVARTESDQDVLGRIGWSSALVAYVINALHQNLRESQYILTKDVIRNAIEFAPSMTRSFSPQRNTCSEHGSNEAQRISIGDLLPWGDEQKSWEAATDPTCRGIVKDSAGNLRLDVWRGATDLPGFVCCLKEKRVLLDKIASSLRAYRDGKRHKRLLSILFIANPGAGKTSLARTLADVFDFSFIGTNITNMIRREEILDFFDAIATQQASQRKPILVFVDEINAKIENSAIYSSFLSPLEDGIYIRRGERFTLRPCAWIFAGTPELEREPDDSKYKDFENRMTLTARMDFASLLEKGKKYRGENDIQSEAQLEQVYLGVNFLLQLHPGVREVSKEILEKFYNHDPRCNPAREIRKQVEGMRNFRGGKATRRNWFYDDPAKWQNIPEDGLDLVRLHLSE